MSSELAMGRSLLVAGFSLSPGFTRSARLDVPVRNEYNRVRSIEHEGARRHDDRRAPRAEVVELTRDARFGMRIHRAGRLDEDEDLCGGEERPHEHESLSLPTRERPSALVDDLVEPGW